MKISKTDFTIFVEARILSKPVSGVGNFLRNVLLAFSYEFPKLKFVLFTNSALSNDYNDISFLPNVELKICSNILFKNSFLYLLFYFPFQIRHIKDLIWCPASNFPPFTFRKHRILLTIHDVVAEKFRSTMSLKNKLAHYVFTKRAIKKSSLFWAVSDYTKSEVEKTYGIEESRIFVGSSIQPNFFYSFTEIERNNAKIRLASKYGIDFSRPTLLYVGSIEPRKNIKFLFSLLPDLLKQNFTLIIIGKNLWGDNGLNLVSSPSVVFANSVSNLELRDFYNVVSCFISTSINEGFGLPQLEAISCGCPVVSHSNSAIREVLSSCGTLIDDWDRTHWLEGIHASINKKDYDIDSYNLTIDKYSWKKICANLLNFINNNNFD